MQDFLLMGLVSLAIIVLEIILTEIFGRRLTTRGRNSFDVLIDGPAWRRLETRMFLISTVLVGFATLYVCWHPVDLSPWGRNIGSIFGGFGYCVIPLYLRRIIFGKTVGG
jgi:hypothetical protein